jgi:N-acetylglutamate synthase-like GNAT family acetyltransferase
MPNIITIRKANISDAPAILEVTRKAFSLYRGSISAEITLSALTESIKDVEHDITKNHVYVAVRQCEATTIEGSLRFSLLSPQVAYIYRIGVNPDGHNAGIGSELLAKAIKDISALGAKAATLHTNSKYFKLVRYYYGHEFYVHSTDTSRGYIRAFFVKDLTAEGIDGIDLSAAISK